MNAVKTLLTPEELVKVEQGQVLEKDYFYIPVIYYSEPSPNYEEIWYSLRFNDSEPPASLMAYASKVHSGQTLRQAVRSDLEKDFDYSHDKSFVIESAKAYDTARNKHGDELTRVLVWVGVYEKFDTSNVHPIGMQLTWYEEGEHVINPVGQYLQGAIGSSTSRLLEDPEIKAILEEHGQLYHDYRTDDEVYSTLDDIANDWLLNDLSEAEAKDLEEPDPAARNAALNAKAVKAKIYAVELKMQQINANYIPSIYEPMKLGDWNPPLDASDEEFFKELAYYFGEQAADIYLNERSAQYDESVVREGVRKALYGTTADSDQNL